MKFGMGKFESIGKMVGDDIERFWKIKKDILKIVVIDKKRLKIGEKKCEEESWGKWIEIEMKEEWKEIEKERNSERRNGRWRRIEWKGEKRWRKGKRRIKIKKNNVLIKVKEDVMFREIKWLIKE